MKHLCISIMTGATLMLGAMESPNLIKNGSFEEGVDDKGVPKHWRLDLSRGAEGKVEVAKKNATAGQYAVHLTKNNTDGSVTLIQNVRLKPNTDYILELKGTRNAAYRWHYYGIRMPDTKIRAEGKIPTQGGICPAIRFTSDANKTLCYINLSLWGYNDNTKATIGEMWIDEVSLRELPRTAGRVSGLPAYAFTSDQLQGKLFSTDFRGEVKLALIGENGKILAKKTIATVPGENSFNLEFSSAPEGTAKFTAVSADGSLKLEHPLMIQKKGF